MTGKIKYPDRSCKKCFNYPCFEGFDRCISDFAKYGCKFYGDRTSRTKGGTK